MKSPHYRSQSLPQNLVYGLHSGHILRIGIRNNDVPGVGSLERYPSYLHLVYLAVLASWATIPVGLQRPSSGYIGIYALRYHKNEGRENTVASVPRAKR